MKLLKTSVFLLLIMPNLSFGGGEGNEDFWKLPDQDQANSSHDQQNLLDDLALAVKFTPEELFAKLGLPIPPINTSNPAVGNSAAAPIATPEDNQNQTESSQDQTDADYKLALEFATQEFESAKRPHPPEAEEPSKKPKLDINFSHEGSKEEETDDDDGLSYYEELESDEELEFALWLSLQSQELEDEQYGTIIKLPENLGKLPVVHLKSIQQYDVVTCGSRATINAWALQTLINEGRSVTAQAIQDKAQEKEQWVPDETLEVGEITDLVNQLVIHNKNENGNTIGNDNVYILKYENGIESATSEVPFTKEQVQKHINLLKPLKQWSLHFICNTGNHWVLISLAKQADAKPVLLYLDSINTAVAEPLVAYHYIQELYATCFAKLDSIK